MDLIIHWLVSQPSSVISIMKLAGFGAFACLWYFTMRYGSDYSKWSEERKKASAGDGVDMTPPVMQKTARKRFAAIVLPFALLFAGASKALSGLRSVSQMANPSVAIRGLGAKLQHAAEVRRGIRQCRALDRRRTHRQAQAVFNAEKAENAQKLRQAYKRRVRRERRKFAAFRESIGLPVMDY